MPATSNPSTKPKADAAEGEQGVIADEQLEQQVRQRQEARKRHEEEGDGPARSGPELIRTAAERKGAESLSKQEVVDATEWLLTDTPDDYTYEFEINVGTPRVPKWTNWTIRPVDLDTLRRIRKAASGQTRSAQRRAQATGDLDEVEANVRIVVEGTVEPDLRQAASNLRVVDPGDVLRRKFAHKPGLLGQIAGEIMGISGYDDEDIREVDAAKNS